MAEEYTLQLSRIIKDLQLTALYLPKSADDIYVKSREVNRPGVALNGFYDFFDPLRICVLGKSEMAMLESFGQEKMDEAIKKFFSMTIKKRFTKHCFRGIIEIIFFVIKAICTPKIFDTTSS